MLTVLHALVWLEGLVPRVDDPLPERIGLSFPFTFAGAGGVIGDLAAIRGSAARRDRTARLGSAAGFALGAVGYAIASAYQLISA